MELEDIKGIGNNLLKKLNTLNIYNINDLLENYPYKYNFINIIDINSAIENESCMIKAIIVGEAKVQYIKRNFNRLNFKAISNNVILNVTIFNRAFLKNNLTINKEVVLIGKYNKLKNSFIASDIKFNVTDNKIEPVYHLVEGLTNNNIIKFVESALNEVDGIADYIPDYINKKYHLL